MFLEKDRYRLTGEIPIDSGKYSQKYRYTTILINPVVPVFTNLAVKGQNDAFIIGEVELEFTYEGLRE